jgi:hypothetical protein
MIRIASELGHRVFPTMLEHCGVGIDDDSIGAAEKGRR